MTQKERKTATIMEKLAKALAIATIIIILLTITL